MPRARDLDNLQRRSTADRTTFARGYDMDLNFNTDGLGLAYIGIVIAWTCLLLPAAIFLIRNRHLSYLRMRNILLATSAVAVLHVYWVLCMIAYVLNGYFPCTTEFWIMSIYLPLGIALFHATNSQLLSIATAQKRYIKGDVVAKALPSWMPQARGWRRWWKKLQAYDATKNTMAWIGIGMIIQIVLALFVFLISKKFHPGFGIISGETTRSGCRRGWEWLPSIGWQIFWAWIYAPILLWKVRDIHDVHGWRSQTIACVIAGLPASPMWLIALYADAMKPVNLYFVPPLWFSASIVIMQASVIFVPFFQIFKNRKLEGETRDIIAEWEAKQRPGNSFKTNASDAAARSQQSTRYSVKSATNSRHGEMYTLSALEKTLQVNPTPLLMFSALKDFSGENISFLIHVRDWKAKWLSGAPRSALLRKVDSVRTIDATLVRRQFASAVGIYASFVSLKYSNFPINISSCHLKELDNMFEGFAALVCSAPAANTATPFDRYWSASQSEDAESQAGKDQLSIVSTAIGDAGADGFIIDSHISRQVQDFKMTNFGERLPPNIGIPDGFGPAVFDHSEQSIKELVLTNTWAKFVKAGFAQTSNKPTLASHFEDVLDTCRRRLPKLSIKLRK